MNTVMARRIPSLSSSSSSSSLSSRITRRQRRLRRQPCWWVGLISCCCSSRTLTTTVGYTPTAQNPRVVAVVGGGASGIFASIAAAEAKNTKVIVLEGTHKTLSKVKISGGGRCNVLHDTTKPVADILGSYPRGSKELTGLYHKHFPPTRAREWFTSRGVQLKTEPDGRMFPTTDNSQTIIDALLRAADQAGVEICHKHRVIQIVAADPTEQQQESSGATGKRFRIETSSLSSLEVDAIVLATGSSKAGHALAEGLGHTIVDPVPSLFTLNTKHQTKEGGLLHGLSGVSVPHARLTLTMPKPKTGGASSNKKRRKPKRLHQEGPLLITHHGVSGPATLRLSAFGAHEFHQLEYRGPVVTVHWCPALGNTEDIADRLWGCTTQSPHRAVSTVCPLVEARIPKRLWSALVTVQSGLSPTAVWGEVSKKHVRALARSLAECVLDLTGKSTYKEEFVTAGGVALPEIDMKTMASKKCDGLFLCGELLNVDGVTGGFNFMNCWSTGHTAGTNAATATTISQQ